MTRSLRQSDVVRGEQRRGPSGETLVCASASATHVGYRPYDDWQDRRVIRRDVWTSWPVIEEAER